MARDTKLGPEEITRDIPNVGEEALKDLDESGIVRIGAEVKPRRHPRRQDHAEGRDAAHSPEEKLLRAIFGEKAGDVRDTSLRRPAGSAGHGDRRARVFSRKGVDKDERSLRSIADADREAEEGPGRTRSASSASRTASRREGALDGEQPVELGHADVPNARIGSRGSSQRVRPINASSSSRRSTRRNLRRCEIRVEACDGAGRKSTGRAERTSRVKADLDPGPAFRREDRAPARRATSWRRA